MPRSVLVVDDSSTVQDAVRFALAGEDWTVHSAADSEAAQEAVRSSPPDAILCDVSLGDEDGYEVCRSLRSLPDRSAIPVIMMGGRVSEGLATAVGAVGVLTKPFASAELLDALQASLESATLGLGLELEEVPLPSEESAAEPTVGDTVEVIDLSDQDEFEEFELLEDLEPVQAGASMETLEETGGDAFAASRTPGFELETTAYAGAAAASEPTAYGDVELPPVDLGSDEAEPEPSPIGREEEPGADESEEFETGEGWGGTAATRGAEPEGDLLGDIDLEGFATPEPPLPATGPAKEATEQEPSSSVAEEAGEPEGVEATGYEGAVETEPPPAPCEPPEAERTCPAAAPEETEDEFYAWASGEPEAGTAGVEVGEPCGEPLELQTETAGEPDSGEAEQPGGTTELEVSETAREEHAESPAAAERTETDPTWAHPEPTPAPGVPWDLAGVEPEPLADAMATRVEEAVREALQENLAPEKLAPVVEAAVERVVWQVVPELAERLIRETIEKLRQDPPDP